MEVAFFENYAASVLTDLSEISTIDPFQRRRSLAQQVLSHEQLDLIRRNGAPQTIQTMECSEDPLKEPDVTCSICAEPYHTEFEPGITEYPFLTACGHVLGAACLKKWLKNQSTCPICRFNLKFRCGHPILPRRAFSSGSANLPTLTFETGVPRSCLDCRLAHLNVYWSAKIDEYRGKLAYLEKKLASLNAWFELLIDSEGDADVESQAGLMNEVELDREEITVQIVRAKADWRADVARLQEGVENTWVASC